MLTTNTGNYWVKTWDRSGREIECHDPTVPDTQTTRSPESTQKPTDKNSKPE